MEEINKATKVYANAIYIGFSIVKEKEGLSISSNPEHANVFEAAKYIDELAIKIRYGRNGVPRGPDSLYQACMRVLAFIEDYKMTLKPEINGYVERTVLLLKKLISMCEEYHLIY